ncbi:MAG TPA: hypothetical protein VG297_18600 [Bryobacteraceae bacterium]|jgi:hypothetical protein|nr:hypothetical protein [Bryobacteraceae bacterium]
MRLGGVLFAAILIGGTVAGAAPAQVNGNTVGGNSNPQTFNATGTFGDGSTLSGTLTIDTGLGSVTGGHLFVTPSVQQTFQGLSSAQGSTSYDFDSFEFGGAFVDLGGNNLWESVDFGATSLPDANLQLDIYLPGQTSLVGYSGGALCTFSFDTGGPCGNQGAYFTNYALSREQLPEINGLESPSGVLAIGELHIASAPEPASWFLLAGPALWVIRRQRRHPQA